MEHARRADDRPRNGLQHTDKLTSSFESRQRVFPSYVSATTRWERFYYTDFQSGEKIDTVVSAPSAPFPTSSPSPPFTSPYTKRSERAPPCACSPAPRPYIPAVTPAAHFVPRARRPLSDHTFTRVSAKVVDHPCLCRCAVGATPSACLPRAGSSRSLGRCGREAQHAFCSLRCGNRRTRPSSGLDPHEDVAGAPSPAERNNRMRHCRRTKTTINPRYSRVRTRCTLQIGRTCPETLSEAGWNSTNIVPGRIGRGGPQLAQRPHKRARRGEPTRSRDPSGSICQRYV